MKEFLRVHLATAAIFYVLSLVVFLVIDSPYPYLASIFIAFFAFELSVYYVAHKRRKGKTHG